MLSSLSALIGPVSAILDKVIPDKDLKEKLAHEIATMAERHTHEQVQAQLEINKAEAAHKNLFVAGWRPACGWVCVFGMAGNFLIIPLANMTLELFETGVEVPMIDLSTMLPVLMGMLGLGGLRTFEKVKGAQKNH
eukprot:GHVR01098520.1.p1 GENE.GHVR01098520.1~~GHVR01098520.1.p1  ORF type:complete len:136 (+),score=13.03 GHVR01098520.1:38-445(+)